jgi:hypothetical protein
LRTPRVAEPSVVALLNAGALLMILSEHAIANAHHDTCASGSECLAFDAVGAINCRCVFGSDTIVVLRPVSNRTFDGAARSAATYE